MQKSTIYVSDIVSYENTIEKDVSQIFEVWRQQPESHIDLWSYDGFNETFYKTFLKEANEIGMLSEACDITWYFGCQTGEELFTQWSKITGKIYKSIDQRVEDWKLEFINSVETTKSLFQQCKKEYFKE